MDSLFILKINEIFKLHSEDATVLGTISVSKYGFISIGICYKKDGLWTILFL